MKIQCYFMKNTQGKERSQRRKEKSKDTAQKIGCYSCAAKPQCPLGTPWEEGMACGHL